MLAIEVVKLDTFLDSWMDQIWDVTKKEKARMTSRFWPEQFEGVAAN